MLLPVAHSHHFHLKEEMLFSFDYAFKRWGFWIREKYVTSDYVELIYAEDFAKVCVCDEDCNAYDMMSLLLLHNVAFGPMNVTNKICLL